MQVDDCPAGRLVAVAIQIEDDEAALAAGHDPIGHRQNPLRRDKASGCFLVAGRGEINRRPGAAGSVRPVRAAGVVPQLVRRPGELECRLAQIRRQQRLHRAGERIAEQSHVQAVEPGRVGVRQPGIIALVEAQEVLHRHGSGIQARGIRHPDALAEGKPQHPAHPPAVIGFVQPVRRPGELLVQPFVAQLHVTQRVDHRRHRWLRVEQPAGPVFEQRQQQARVHAVIVGHAPHDLRAADHLAVNPILVGVEIARQRGHERRNIEAGRRRPAHQLAVRDDLERRAEHAPRLRQAHDLADRDQRGILDRVQRHELLDRRAEALGDGREGIAALHRVGIRQRLHRGAARRVKRRQDQAAGQRGRCRLPHARLERGNAQRGRRRGSDHDHRRRGLAHAGQRRQQKSRQGQQESRSHELWL